MMQTMISRIAISGAVALGLLGSAAAEAQAFKRLRAMRAARAQQAATADSAGTVAHKITVGSTSRDYLVLDGANGRANAPLIIVLHGGGGNAATMVGRWAAKAKQAGLVIAFPNGATRDGRMATWNAGGCCAYAMKSNSDDVAFIGAVIDTVQRESKTDPKRVYVTGMSNGGMMTYRVAIALGDRIAAAGVVAGAMFGGEAAARSPVPMLIMHGVKDEVVPFAGGASTIGFVAQSQSLPFKPVSYAVDFWRNANGCAAAPAKSTSGDVTLERFTGCKGADLSFYSLASANHTWPGAIGLGPSQEKYRYDQVNATDVVWDFFAAHVRQ